MLEERVQGWVSNHPSYWTQIRTKFGSGPTIEFTIETHYNSVKKYFLWQTELKKGRSTKEESLPSYTNFNVGPPLNPLVYRNLPFLLGD